MKKVTQLLVALSLFGCLQSDEDPPARLSGLSAHENSDSATAATSWSDQIEAVRSGEADSIRVSVEQTVSSNDLRELETDCENLRSLWIERADFAGEDLQLLPSLPRLTGLRLPTHVDDRGLSFIAECDSLKNLNLPNGRFTDAGLAALANLSQLESLRIGSPNATDNGLKVIRQLPHLRFLHLIGMPITDVGLEHVAAVASLESFYLDGGKATDDGLRSLLRERPDLHFHKDQKHLPEDPNSHDHE